MANKSKTLGQVQKHIAREQYDRAIKLLQQLVEEDPNDVRSLLKLGDVYVKKGDRDVAVDVYKRVARQYSEQGFFMKAVAIYKQILKHQSKNVEALMQLAELYEHLGLASEARQQYLLAESVLQEAGDSSAALALMQKQVELDPDNVAHRIKLAEAYSSEDNIAAATRQFAAAAEVLRRQNREDDFIKVAERLVYHDPNRPEVLRDLARLYLTRGDAKRALAKLQLCFRSHPKDIETLELLAQAFSELRQYARTKTVYQELVQVLEDKGMLGKAEEYRLLIRQLEEADRPTPASPSGQILGAFQDSPASNLNGILGQNGVHEQNGVDGSGDLSGIADVYAPLQDHASNAYAAASVEYDAGTPSSILSAPPPYSGSAHAFQHASANLVSADPIEAPYPSMPPPSSSLDTGYSNGVPPNGSADLDDLIIEPPVESGDVATTAPPPPPTPETTVEQQIASLVRDARVYQRYNLPAGALEQLQRALELDPDNIDVLEQMRDLYMAEGDPSRAADVVGELVKVHFRNGDRDAAEHAKRQIIQLAPAHPLAVDAMAGELPAMTGHDQREDSLSFVITEDSGSFEIVDVAESGSVSLEAPEEITQEAPHAHLPEPQFANTGPLPDPLDEEDDEPLNAFTNDMVSEGSLEMDEDLLSTGAAPSPVTNGAVSDVFSDPYSHLSNGHEEDPTTLGEPVRLQPDTDDSYDITNGHNVIEYDLPRMASSPSAAELGSPAGMPASELDAEPEPVTAQATAPGGLLDVTDELAEVQFFLDVGDEDGARDALRELLDQHPEHPEVLALAMALDVETTRGKKPPTNDVTSEDVQAAFDNVLDEVQSDDQSSEVQDTYDEGVALMDLERFAQAIEKFESAAQWPSMAATAREMLVRCFAQMDQPAQAVAHFRDAEAHGVSGAAATHLKYVVACCFERTKDLVHALEWFESCAADDPSHQDVQEQVKRVALLVYGAAAGEEFGAAEQRNKISYL